MMPQRSSPSGSFIPGWPSHLLPLTASTFRLELFFHRPPRRARLLPRLGGRGSFPQHGSQLLQTVGHIAPLVAKTLAIEDQLPSIVDAPVVAGHESAAHIIRQRPGSGDIPVQRHLRVDLIDVLSSRSTAARERERELPQGNRDAVVDFEHDGSSVCGRRVSGHRASSAKKGVRWKTTGALKQSESMRSSRP